MESAGRPPIWSLTASSTILLPLPHERGGEGAAADAAGASAAATLTTLGLGTVPSLISKPA
jgi:hypothetical protein